MGSLVAKRLLILGSFAILLPLAAGGTAAQTGDRAGGSTPRAYGIALRTPGPAGQGTPALFAPPDAGQFGGAFAYPADGSVASADAVTLSVSADSGAVATAT